jgi:hypothetical protein
MNCRTCGRSEWKLENQKSVVGGFSVGSGQSSVLSWQFKPIRFSGGSEVSNRPISKMPFPRSERSPYGRWFAVFHGVRFLRWPPTPDALCTTHYAI